MNSFQKEFITNLFLDTDSTCNINRLVVAIANVVNENNDNLCIFNELIKKEYDQGFKQNDKDSLCHVTSPSKINGYYEYIMQNFSDHDFCIHFKMKRSTVEVCNNHIKFL